MSTNPDSEAALEEAIVALFAQMGWATVNAYYEAFSPATASPRRPYLGRDDQSQVVLRPRLRAALERLNPGLPAEVFDLALEALTRHRGLLEPARANQEIYHLLKEGVNISYRDEQNEAQVASVRVLDWAEPERNDFLLAAQLWVSGEYGSRRPDLIGFVNGLPLLFIELKTSHVRLENAYRHNYKDYRDTIPALFWYNGLIILSNGSDSRVGSLTAPWEHTSEWKRINAEGESGLISLETTLRATCPPARLLDLLENFTLFSEAEGGLHKLVAKNHQFLGVNKALAAVEHLGQNQGRLGVFWHTQGSGKSYSMIFLGQKVLRRLPGNWTFVVITDRLELDEQIYKTFARAGVVTEPEKRVRAQDAKHLKELLREDHRYVFTLIHKFRAEPGEVYEVLSLRRDIIIMVDEAHRSQYDTLALNMRNALPNAAFIAFTGTPLMAGEERTREVFGDYISVYNFKQSVDDQATVPLYYENRIPELQLSQPINPEIEAVLEAAALDEAQEQRLEQEFKQEYHLITRKERLERVAGDIVDHFIGRAYRGKAMVVSVDKLTAGRMFANVQRVWQQRLADLQARLATCSAMERAELEGLIAFMAETDMALVVSAEQGEIEKFAQKGLDIRPQRKRMLSEDLEEKFKDPANPFRLVFVCAMWMTGFDVPNCSTIYLDKPMRNHTLMQTIARANRVYAGKHNGLIVDYIGVFRNLQQALAIYGAGTGAGETPVKGKEALLDELGRAIEAALRFCAGQEVAIDAILAETDVFKRTALKKDACDALLVNDQTKLHFLSLAAEVVKIYKAILPDKAAGQFQPRAAMIGILAMQIKRLDPEVDIAAVIGEVEAVLDQAITPHEYIIRGGKPASLADTRVAYEVEGAPHLLDLSKIDFELLAQQFKQGHKRTEVEKLRGAVSSALKQMIRLNRQRLDFQAQFQRMIDEYNSGSRGVEETYQALIELVKSLNSEAQRHLAEGLSEEELAIFDLLTRKPELKLSKKERQAVKSAARELLAKLKDGKLALDWRKRQQSQAEVLVTIQDVLDTLLPPAYTPELYQAKCELVYQHIHENYYGEGRSTYSGLPLAG